MAILQSIPILVKLLWLRIFIVFPICIGELQINTGSQSQKLMLSNTHRHNRGRATLWAGLSRCRH